MAGRTQAVEDKRRQLLDAAVRVFARKGFHASRVGDIAEEAGVAHGLLYHYFRSKDEVLEEVFHENWSVLLARIESVEATDEPAADQLRHISAIVLRTWLHLPDVVRVVIQEFGRSPEVAERIGELDTADRRNRASDRARNGARRVSQRHRSALRCDGRLRLDRRAPDRWVLGRLPASEEDVAAAERTLLEVSLLGLQNP